jgi:uncharacterized protein YbaA (DUF1428 family)
VKEFLLENSHEGMHMTKKYKYVDGFVLPVPKNKIKEYKKMAKLAGKIWLDHGAIDYVECLADDVKPGKITSFPQSVKLKKGEVVIFSWATYKSKAHRNQVMNDPRMEAYMDPKKLPFDGKRMFWGGFTPVVKL